MNEANTQYALRKSIKSSTAFTAVIFYTATIVTSILSVISGAAQLMDALSPYINELRVSLPFLQLMVGSDIDLSVLLDRFISLMTNGPLIFALIGALPRLLIALGLWMILISSLTKGPVSSAGFTVIKVIMILDVIGLILNTILIEGLLVLLFPILRDRGVSDGLMIALIASLVIFPLLMLFPIFFCGFAAKSLTRAREIARNGGEENDIRLSGYVGFLCIVVGGIGCIIAAVLLMSDLGTAIAGNTVITSLSTFFFGLSLFKCRSNLRRADEIAKPFYDPPAVVRPQNAEEPAQGAAVYPQPAPGPYGATRRIIIHGRGPEHAETADPDLPTEDGESERPLFCPDCGAPLTKRGMFCPRCGCCL